MLRNGQMEMNHVLYGCRKRCLEPHVQIESSLKLQGSCLWIHHHIDYMAVPKKHRAAYSSDDSSSRPNQSCLVSSILVQAAGSPETLLYCEKLVTRFWRVGRKQRPSRGGSSLKMLSSSASTNPQGSTSRRGILSSCECCKGSRGGCSKDKCCYHASGFCL